MRSRSDRKDMEGNIMTTWVAYEDKCILWEGREAGEEFPLDEEEHLHYQIESLELPGGKANVCLDLRETAEEE
jgi:hypothetical protein